MTVLGGCQQYNNLRMKYKEGKLFLPFMFKPFDGILLHLE